jgi:hypothetical protein
MLQYQQRRRRRRLKKLLISIIASMFFVVSANAIEIILPVKPGGGTSKTAGKLKENLDKQGVETKLTFTGNCKLAEKIWNDATDETIMIANAGLWSTGCKLGYDTPEENIIVMVKAFPHSICRPANRPDLTIEKFLDPKQKKIIGTSFVYVNAINKWLKETGHTQEVINFGNSKKLKIASVTTDADYYIMYNSHAAQLSNNLTCVANASVYTASHPKAIKAPLLSSVTNMISSPTLLNADMVIVKNPKNIKELRKTFEKAINAKEYKDFLNGPGIIDVTAFTRKEVLVMIKFLRETYGQ